VNDIQQLIGGIEDLLASAGKSITDFMSYLVCFSKISSNYDFKY
jgi:hypothetical protein